MKTTVESTAEVDLAVARDLSPTHAAFIRSVCDDYSARQAAERERAGMMRRKRSRHLRACILVAARLHRLQLKKWTSTATSRAKWLQNQMQSAITLAASRGETPMLPKPPSARLISGILKKLPFLQTT
ncbi:MAG: hypothetical protein ACI9UK_000670 [Candidatus Krumholzibacteriia bacterium]|jgi:hypothetical protein